MKNYRKINGKKIHLNQLASMSRQSTVKNTKKNISPVVKHVRYGGDIPKDMLITNPLTGNQFVMTNPHTITGNYGVTITGHDWIPVEEYKSETGLLWKREKHPQPKSYWNEIIDGKPTMVKSTSLHKDPVKMNKVQYYEKLIEHKLQRWERKNPAPADMFIEEVEKWKQLQETMKERFRDFVISIYDPLIIMGNRVNSKERKLDANKIAEVKDVDGKGHDVTYPNLSSNDKLYKNAESAAKVAMKKDASILDADLMNHKRNQKRPLIGAKRTTLADKKLKKAA